MLNSILFSYSFRHNNITIFCKERNYIQIEGKNHMEYVIAHFLITHSNNSYFIGPDGKFPVFTKYWY